MKIIIKVQAAENKIAFLIYRNNYRMIPRPLWKEWLNCQIKVVLVPLWLQNTSIPSIKRWNMVGAASINQNGTFFSIIKVDFPQEDS